MSVRHEFRKSCDVTPGGNCRMLDNFGSSDTGTDSDHSRAILSAAAATLRIPAQRISMGPKDSGQYISGIAIEWLPRGRYRQSVDLVDRKPSWVSYYILENEINEANFIVEFFTSASRDQVLRHQWPAIDAVSLVGPLSHSAILFRRSLVYMDSPSSSSLDSHSFILPQSFHVVAPGPSRT
jgi:hypothetical protein